MFILIELLLVANTPFKPLIELDWSWEIILNLSKFVLSSFIFIDSSLIWSLSIFRLFMSPEIDSKSNLWNILLGRMLVVIIKGKISSNLKKVRYPLYR